jgi:hypothetical protein
VDASSDVTGSEASEASEVGESGSDGADRQEATVAEGSSPDADTGASAPRICAEACTADEDCARETGVQRFVCHPATHHCSTCIDDMICVASRSLWIAKTCTLDAECINDGGFSQFGDVCIQIGATGYCAFLASNTAGCTSALNTATFSTFTVKKFGSDDRVDVCGKPSRCDADRGSCQNPCTSNTSCNPARGGKTCNTGTGRCECASDGDCGPGAPKCNLLIKQCECGTQDDCAADTGRTLTCQ